jgi:toxin ParE1/3/4
MVKWTGHALAQLRHIHEYIAQDSALYARRVA